MQVQEFRLTIFQQKRILLSILFFLAGFLFNFFALTIINLILLKIIFHILFLALLIAVLFYYSIGFLTISVKDDWLHFAWKNKRFFNYKELPSIHISEIKTVIIDNDELLKKIVTEDKVIALGNGKLSKKSLHRRYLYLHSPILLLFLQIFGFRGYHLRSR